MPIGSIPLPVPLIILSSASFKYFFKYFLAVCLDQTIFIPFSPTAIVLGNGIFNLGIIIFYRVYL